MLRIGELASYVDVTTRTVRFYHQQGLLAEPERNAAGYRLYDADAVLRLSRIVALASAGVPLAHVGALLGASQETLDAAVAQIDTDLRHRIHKLRDDRARLQRLRAGDALVLPGIVVHLVAHLRSAGIDDALVDHYRDAWVLTLALYRTKLAPWLEEFGATMFGDPGYLALMVRSFQTATFEADDPEIARLANDTVDWMVDNWDTYTIGSSFQSDLDDVRANALMEAQWTNRPAWVRVSELIISGLAERGIEHPMLQR